MPPSQESWRNTDRLALSWASRQAEPRSHQVFPQCSLSWSVNSQKPWSAPSRWETNQRPKLASVPWWGSNQHTQATSEARRFQYTAWLRALLRTAELLNAHCIYTKVSISLSFWLGEAELTSLHHALLRSHFPLPLLNSCAGLIIKLIKGRWTGEKS